MGKPITQITGLSKSFKDIQAVDNLSLTVFENDVYGFLGPNGSGKSTSIRMLLSLIRPDRGDIQVFGLNLRNNRMEILRQIGAFVEKADFYEYLSARKNLEILARYSGYTNSAQRIMEVLELVGLLKRSESKVKTFSKGMKQRLGIAQALLHKPRLLVLDEPASGLDPSGMRDIRQLIRFLNEDQNITIILSSHNLQEIEHIANRMIIINNGKKMVEGEVKSLLLEHKYYTSIHLNDARNGLELLKKSTIPFEEADIEGQSIRIFCQRSEIPAINKLMVDHGLQVDGIKVEQNLEDYFLTLT
ncbi:MAG: ABC transporter ATP-binding protein [Bacteroidetes bacterium]|nr:ABC transporter ATP-binding protein [Bacteroidota bacterium]